MWTEAFDLHSHSTNSDGEHPVADVAKMMAESKVRFWSLTDHDTISGWSSAKQAAESEGLGFIPGVEISTNEGFHILCYFKKIDFMLFRLSRMMIR